MQRRLLLVTMILVAACGDGGPEISRFEGLWRLTSVNVQPLPSTGNTTGGDFWVAAVLQIERDFGFFERCLEASSTSPRTSQSTTVLIAPISGDRITFSYFDRRQSPPDTARLDGAQLTLRFRNTLTGAFDVLTFVPLAGQLPPACSLAP
jgi:hypothetical protein